MKNFKKILVTAFVLVTAALSTTIAVSANSNSSQYGYGNSANWYLNSYPSPGMNSTSTGFFHTSGMTRVFINADSFNDYGNANANISVTSSQCVGTTSLTKYVKTGDLSVMNSLPSQAEVRVYFIGSTRLSADGFILETN